MKGKGYVKDKLGHILYKLDLPKNREHKLNLKEGEVFVADQKIDKIECWLPPVIETAEEKKEKLISEKIREIAIRELKAEGKI